MKKILVLGCSHTSGHGFDDSDNGRNISKHVWPSKIANDFDCEVINLSSPGHSPTYCADRLHNFTDKNSLSAIMIQWPHHHRTLMRMTSPHGVDEDIPYHNSDYSAHPRWNNTIISYFKLCHNWRTNTLNLLSYAAYSKMVASQLRIPLWMNTSTSDDYEFLKQNGVELDVPQDWLSYCQLNSLPKLPDGHYGHEAHENFYKEFIKPWLRKNGFINKS